MSCADPDKGAASTRRHLQTKHLSIGIWQSSLRRSTFIPYELTFSVRTSVISFVPAPCRDLSAVFLAAGAFLGNLCGRLELGNW
jgi:hypothetical protein